MRDTIFALATAPGRAAVAIVRVSGPRADAIFQAMAGPLPNSRHVALRRLRTPHGEVFDHGLAIWFAGPQSFTGEDVFELQVHGGPAIMDAALRSLAELGARPAEPGEFTRRAFESGRMELSQAEAVADLVDAETEAQRRQALNQLGGALAKRNQVWRDTLLNALAFLGAQIDFPEDDLPPEVAKRALEPIERLAIDIEASVADVRGERIREGVRIALIGAPNAGKSSLMNALVGREAAIVAASPGSTRDVIEVSQIVSGYRVVFADMAGLRNAIDEVEVEGVRRAHAWAKSADLRLWLVDPHVATDAQVVAAHMHDGDALVVTKTDLGARSDSGWSEWAMRLNLVLIETSVISPEGLAPLRRFIDDWVITHLTGSTSPIVTRLRHRRLLEQAAAHLRRALERSIDDAEMIAADVGLAGRALEQISGRLDPEAVLDRIFGSFCIGK